MKIRNGFVSNSSSSSFIVAARSSEKCKCCGRQDDNILDIIETQCGRGRDYEETEIKARGIDEIMKYFKDNYGEDYDTEHRNEMAALKGKMVEATELGYDVGMIELGYHDEHYTDVIGAHSRNGLFVRLWSDHENIDIGKVEL